ncbi:imidazole glycerol phosphate synthase subunit HisF [Agrococcus sp. Marseille-P2731]|uniref:imidazole glycerol phosphate synthase subunit HisF n=1 Tax=Agrococcus sp. Marseille-P2731 TaxID=1841862 RepID=UPI000931329A|nr:imidazole glycerol phosphate synthase subunit HisF [Agrococcus sp. Marseille-P2731]
MLATRVIPCLDVAHGRVVKGVRFQGLTDQGDPVELAARYAEQGADELTFLDVKATVEDAGTMLDVVERCAEQIFIPLTVGGGVRSRDDVARLLAHGADKVGVNSAAIRDPGLIDRIVADFGSQVLVLSLDVRRAAMPSGFEVTTHGGSRGAGLDAIRWAEEAVSRGVGELLVNSIDADGTKQGFDLELLRLVRAAATTPVIASGGAGEPAHFAPAVEAGADAVLAASIFHTGQCTIGEVKEAMREAGVTVR